MSFTTATYRRAVTAVIVIFTLMNISHDMNSMFLFFFRGSLCYLHVMASFGDFFFAKS